MHLQLGLLLSERILTMFPGSLMHFGVRRLSIAALKIPLQARTLPIGVLTLKGRAISPAAHRFIETARSLAGSMPAAADFAPQLERSRIKTGRPATREPLLF